MRTEEPEELESEMVDSQMNFMLLEASHGQAEELEAFGKASPGPTPTDTMNAAATLLSMKTRANSATKSESSVINSDSSGQTSISMALANQVTSGRPRRLAFLKAIVKIKAEP
ncbi:hypothetical protein BC833DRAFT_623260 [Globomyces pollinis-pini]|nr:hypothetical protein BC833DRAFT_623260 [Globomyces pollinis-pini]